MASGHRTAAGAFFISLWGVVEPRVVLQEVAVTRALCQPAGEALPGKLLEEGLGRVPVPSSRGGSVGLRPSVHVRGRDATFLGRRGKEDKPRPDARAFGLPLGPSPQARGCLVQAGPTAIRRLASLIHRGWLAGNITMRFLHRTCSLSIKHSG